MRRRVLVTVVVASLVLVGAEATLQVFGDRLGEPQFWYAPDAQQLVEDMERLEAAGITSDVVFTGSSMVQFGIRSSIVEADLGSVDAAHNAGIPKGYTTVTRRWLLEEVMPRLQPDRVVWGLSSIDFNGGRPTPAIIEYEAARAGALGFFGWVDRGLWSVSAIARYRDILREPSFLFDLGADQSVRESEIELDDLMEPVVWPNVSQTPRAFAALRSSLLADFQIGDRHAADFRATVEALLADGVEVVVVLLPVSAPYVDAHPDGAAGFALFTEWLEGEVASLGVPLFDYSRAIPEEEFLDYNHVSPDGATQLTEMIVSDLESIGW